MPGQTSERRETAERLARRTSAFRGCLLGGAVGDSDSTGAIPGNILGTLLGVEAIPPRWLEALELREEITAVADDLQAGYRDTDEWHRRYPGW